MLHPAGAAKQRISLITLRGPRGKTIKTSTAGLRRRGELLHPLDFQRLSGYHPEMRGHALSAWKVTDRRDARV